MSRWTETIGDGQHTRRESCSITITLFPYFSCRRTAAWAPLAPPPMIATSRTIVSLALNVETSISAQAAGSAERTSRGATREIIFARCSFPSLSKGSSWFVTREEGILFILPREQNCWKICRAEPPRIHCIHTQALAQCEVSRSMYTGQMGTPGTGLSPVNRDGE